MYTEEELLPLSGLQHFAFCQRQWALIHLERLWTENRLTAEGRAVHEKVHGETEEARGGVVTVRGLPLHSFRLGVAGQSDVVEYRRAEDGGGDGDGAVALTGRKGRWQVMPVEYKRGKEKRGACDRVQLCAQAMCLEEMLGAEIEWGALYYATPRRRTMVRLDETLRNETERLAAAMHEMFTARRTPAARYFAGCRSCSLKGQCLPEVERSAAGHYAALLAQE